jgi:hypothetical protein
VEGDGGWEAGSDEEGSLTLASRCPFSFHCPPLLQTANIEVCSEKTNDTSTILHSFRPSQPGVKLFIRVELDRVSMNAPNACSEIRVPFPIPRSTISF